MKRIEAIIRPDKVADVCTALDGIGQHEMTISTVEGRGGGPAWNHYVRGATYSDTVRERSRVEVVSRDEDAMRVVSAMRNAAATGGSGDGNIFVHDLAEVISIRMNESGNAAL